MEINDIRSTLTIINVSSILLFGLSFAWFGLVISALGVVKDIFVDKKVNGFLMHSANVALNIYLIFLLK